MATTTESISKNLGRLRKGLIDEGFEEKEAFQITLDLLRRADNLPPVVELEK